MSFKVEKGATKNTQVHWKDAVQGQVYRSGEYLAYTIAPGTSSGKYLRAVSLVEAENLKPGDVWQPGEQSKWQPMDTVLTISEK